MGNFGKLVGGTELGEALILCFYPPITPQRTRIREEPFVSTCRQPNPDYGVGLRRRGSKRAWQFVWDPNGELRV